MDHEQAMKARVLETAPQDLSRLLAASNATGRIRRSKAATIEGGTIVKGMQGA
jgi:hypothetical protein